METSKEQRLNQLSITPPHAATNRAFGMQKRVMDKDLSIFQLPCNRNVHDRAHNSPPISQFYAFTPKFFFSISAMRVIQDVPSCIMVLIMYGFGINCDSFYCHPLHYTFGTEGFGLHSFGSAEGRCGRSWRARRAFGLNERIYKSNTTNLLLSIRLSK
jgi:hypothetical protein